MIYGDTDSTFVHLGRDVRPEQADEIGQRLAKMINDNWAALIRREFDLPSHLEIRMRDPLPPFPDAHHPRAEKGSKALCRPGRGEGRRRAEQPGVQGAGDGAHRLDALPSISRPGSMGWCSTTRSQ